MTERIQNAGQQTLNLMSLANEISEDPQTVFAVYTQARQKIEATLTPKVPQTATVATSAVTPTQPQNAITVMEPETMMPTLEVQECWTNEEVIRKAVELKRQGKTDEEVKALLLDEYDDVEADFSMFIKTANVKIAESLEKQAEEIEAAQASEDYAKKAGSEAQYRVHDMEFALKKIWVEKFFALRNWRQGLSDEDVEKYFTYCKEIEIEEKAWMVPVPINTGLPAVPSFSEDFLPESIRPWVVDVSERMSVPLDFAGTCCLVVLAGSIGRRIFVYPKAKDKEWKESIALSGGVVSPSGTLKTPTWKIFINLLVELEMDWRKEYATETSEYSAAVKQAEEITERNEKVKAGGAQELLPPVPDEPVLRRILVNDATPEAAHVVMQDNPEGILYYRDELSSWVKELDKKGYEIARGLFLAAMNGNDAYGMDRIERGSVHAFMCASVFGGFQPKMFQDFLNNTNNIADGMIPRFTFLIWPDERRSETVDRQADDNAKLQFRMVVRKLTSLKTNAVWMHFSPKAQDIFNEWWERLNDQISRELDPGKQSHLSKYRGALPKIAALLQIVDVVASGANIRNVTPVVNLETGETTEEITYGREIAGEHLIDVEHLQQAIKLLGYLEAHMHRIYGCILSPVQAAEKALVDRIADRSLTGSFTARDIFRRRWSGIKYQDTIELALENLQDKHWVRIVRAEPGLGGRPTMRWEVNPRVSEVI
jgi:putative DNA primase/helicase